MMLQKPQWVPVLILFVNGITPPHDRLIRKLLSSGIISALILVWALIVVIVNKTSQFVRCRNADLVIQGFHRISLWGRLTTASPRMRSVMQGEKSQITPLGAA